jgi:p-cymene methyl-monooxygenase electron transfer component
MLFGLQFFCVTNIRKLRYAGNLSTYLRSGVCFGMSVFSKLFAKAAPKQVNVQPGGHHFAVAPGETLLERALKEGLNYPHDCTVGTCGTCRTKLVSGKVDAITPFSYTLSKAELEAGYILACQAVPKSDLVVEIEIGRDDAAAAQTQPARLISADDLTHDIKRVCWEVARPVLYRAGQYMNIRWGAAAHRSYSFATAPGAGGRTELTTFVRHVPGGMFTDILFGEDPFALSFEVEAPLGQFWLRDGTGPILCIAGGSGLAPILSLLEDAGNRKVRRDCILLFGARGEQDLYAANEIAAIRAKWTAGFDYWPILSEAQSPGLRHGLVTAHVGAALERLGSNAQGYLCGPPGMIDAGIAALDAAGIGLEDIHYDKFTDASTQA